MDQRSSFFAALALAAVVASTAHACPDEAAAAVPYDGRERVYVPCTRTPPTIDGRIGELEWAGATVFDDFGQAEPNEGASPSQRTVVRVLHTPDALYVAVRAYDTQPELIRAAVQVRDETLEPDDRVSLVIDSLNSRRDAFMFQLNPLGARRDMLIQNNSDFYTQWRGIWYGASSVDGEGWSAEFRIPVKTLVFDGNGDEWGFNVLRTIRRNEEDVRWTSVRRDLNRFNVSQVGTLTGMGAVDPGAGLDIRTTASLSWVDDAVAGESGARLDPSANLFYRFTPSLTGSLTFNTDFSEAPVDERRVNLGRFRLFFPETRDFFLQDAGVFEFGTGDNNGRPFHSRRIGLVGSEVVDLVAGGKLTGRVGGDLNVGLLSVRTDATPQLALDAQHLTVARVAADVLDESSVGVIYTQGNPAGGPDNRVYGADFRYRNSNAFGNRRLTATAWAQRSETDGLDGSDHAWGARLAYPNDRVNWSLQFTELGENFNPELGFVNRSGIRDWSSRYRYRWRPESRWLRHVDAHHVAELTTDLDNRTESAYLAAETVLRSEGGDQVRFTLPLSHERLDEPFFLPMSLRVPAGEYTFWRPRVQFSTSTDRPVAINGIAAFGRHYDGTRTAYRVGGDLRPSRFFHLRFQFEHETLASGGQRGIVRVGSVEMNLNLTPDLQWSNTVQYDNVTEGMGLNSRLRWIMRPGSEMYLVINQDFLAEDWGRYDGQRTESVIKLGHTIRL